MNHIGAPSPSLTPFSQFPDTIARAAVPSRGATRNKAETPAWHRAAGRRLRTGLVSHAPAMANGGYRRHGGCSTGRCTAAGLAGLTTVRTRHGERRRGGAGRSARPPGRWPRGLGRWARRCGSGPVCRPTWRPGWRGGRSRSRRRSVPPGGRSRKTRTRPHATWRGGTNWRRRPGADGRDRPGHDGEEGGVGQPGAGVDGTTGAMGLGSTANSAGAMGWGDAAGSAGAMGLGGTAGSGGMAGERGAGAPQPHAT